MTYRYLHTDIQGHPPLELTVTIYIQGMPDLNEIIRLGALAATYQSGFAILFESVDERGIPDPRIQLACLDASLIMRPIFTKFHSGLGS